MSEYTAHHRFLHMVLDSCSSVRVALLTLAHHQKPQQWALELNHEVREEGVQDK